MTDAPQLSDILIGRIDLLRQNVDGLFEELVKPSSTSTVTEAVKTKLQTCEQYLNFIAQLGPKFDDEANKSAELERFHRSAFVEEQWKRDVQDKGVKAAYAFRSQLAHKFPSFADQQNALSMPAPTYFQPRPSKKPRFLEELRHPGLSWMLGVLSHKFPSITFSKASIKDVDENPRICGIKVKLAGIFDAYLALKPTVPDIPAPIFGQTDHAIPKIEENTMPSVESIAIVGDDEDCSVGAWGSSRFLVFRRISEHAQEALAHFQIEYPDKHLLYLLTWITYYQHFWETPCHNTKKLLMLDADSGVFLPPTFRDFTDGRAYFSKCVP